jgi:hypothetical protein
MGCRRAPPGRPGWWLQRRAEWSRWRQTFTSSVVRTRVDALPAGDAAGTATAAFRVTTGIGQSLVMSQPKERDEAGLRPAATERSASEQSVFAGWQTLPLTKRGVSLGGKGRHLRCDRRSDQALAELSATCRKTRR